MKYYRYLQEELLYKNLDDNGYFKGYASIFNIKDSYNDVILPGAFKNSLKQNPSIKLLWQHDHKEPIGIISEIKEDEKGLLVSGKLLMELQRAKEAYALIANNVIKGLSIGYTIEDYFTESNINYLTKINLVEISLVTFPANKLAGINYLKSDDELAAFINSITKASGILVGDTGVEPVTSTMST